MEVSCVFCVADDRSTVACKSDSPLDASLLEEVEAIGAAEISKPSSSDFGPSLSSSATDFMASCTDVGQVADFSWSLLTGRPTNFIWVIPEGFINMDFDFPIDLAGKVAAFSEKFLM